MLSVARMIRATLAAAALLIAPIPAFAQNQQEALDDRYDRALAAGYKALFLCSAIANAERNGTTRTPESVHEWELSGIQAPLDQIVRDLPYRIVRSDRGHINFVGVSWAEDMPERFAVHRYRFGCSLAPIGINAEDAASAVRQPRIAQTKTLKYRFGRKPDLLGPEATQDLKERAFGQDYGDGARTTALFVVSDRTVVLEHYADGFGPKVPQRTWSVAKSIAATLIGDARGVDVFAPTGIEEWQKAGDPRAQITVDQLLRMASGRYSDTAGNRTDPVYWGGSTVEERALDWPLLHEPGTVYRYANNDTLMAVKALAGRGMAKTPSAFFRDKLMHDTVAETDWSGNYVLSSQVWSTAPDLARFGMLYLGDGSFGRMSRWREYVSSPSGPQPQGRGVGYGAGFWLFNQSDGIPPDTFAAMGNRGQYVVIVPSRDVVIVRRGEDPAGHRFDIIAFTRDVLAALPE